jgi:hypothetical protein
MAEVHVLSPSKNILEVQPDGSRVARREQTKSGAARDHLKIMSGVPKWLEHLFKHFAGALDYLARPFDSADCGVLGGSGSALADGGCACNGMQRNDIRSSFGGALRHTACSFCCTGHDVAGALPNVFGLAPRPKRTKQLRSPIQCRSR